MSNRALHVEMRLLLVPAAFAPAGNTRSNGSPAMCNTHARNCPEKATSFGGHTDMGTRRTPGRVWGTVLRCNHSRFWSRQAELTRVAGTVGL
jgi:hypothetical protein